MFSQQSILDKIHQCYQLYRQQGENFCLAIDGRAAAGKSTLAALLEKELQADVIHMDDFYLPVDLRTQERFQEPGGNVHWERFLEEVAPYLERQKEDEERRRKNLSPKRRPSEKSEKQNGEFQYRIFDCQRMQYRGFRNLKGRNFVVVEGAYSLRPELRYLYDAALFMDIDPDLQKQRIQKRNGKEGWENFCTRWIPLEEAYHSYYRTEQFCEFYEKAKELET